MDDKIASIPVDVFPIAVRTRIFTDQEIAHWIRHNRVSGKQKLEIVRAIAEYNGAPPIAGILRTALREWKVCRLSQVTRPSEHGCTAAEYSNHPRRTPASASANMRCTQGASQPSKGAPVIRIEGSMPRKI